MGPSISKDTRKLCYTQRKIIQIQCEISIRNSIRCQVICARVQSMRLSARYLRIKVILLTGTSVPEAGIIFPSMYRTVMYNQTDEYAAQMKVYIRNTWDWITVNLRKSDMVYIYRHCKNRRQCATDTLRLSIEAKVPRSAKRSICTFSMLISLNAVLMSA